MSLHHGDEDEQADRRQRRCREERDAREVERRGSPREQGEQLGHEQWADDGSD